MVASISEIEQVCNQFFAGLTPSTLVQSTNYRLEGFLNDPECASSSMLLLERANSQYSIYFGALGLARAYSKPTVSFGPSTVLDHKDRILKFLFTKSVPTTIQTAICKAYAVLVKRYWFMKVNKEFPMQDDLQNYFKWCKDNDQQKLTLILLLTNLVNVIMNVDKKESYILQSTHTRISLNFGKNYLIQIFSYAVELIREFADNISSVNSFSSNNAEILERVLMLCKECFSQDNQDTGICDDVRETMSLGYNTVEWNKAFSANSIRALFKLAVETQVEIACECLSLLANFSCTRSCRFETKDRSAFLKAYVDGILDVLKNHSIKLSNQQYYYSFFRLITLMKSNNRVREFSALTNYEEFLELLKTFTIAGIETMQSSSNNLLYTINAWKPIVSAYTLSRNNNELKLHKHVLNILQVFITERLKYLYKVVSDGAEDPLDDSSSLSQMLDVVSIISEVCSTEFGQFVLNCFDPLLDQLQESVKTLSPKEADVVQYQLALLVHVLACVASASDNRVSSRNSSTAASIFRILKLMAFMKDLNKKFEKLEIAIITFLMRFETTYLTAVSPQALKLYRELNELCGIANEREMMRFVLEKIKSNLSVWVNSYAVINLTLSFLSDLVFNASSAKIITSLDLLGDFTKSCSTKSFPLLRVNQTDPDCLKIMRCRTKLFESIGQLCCRRLEESRNENEFISLLQPLLDQFAEVKKLMSNSDYSRETQLLIVGLARDLRGFCSAMSTTEAYVLFFDAIHFDYLEVLSTALEKFYNVPEVTSPILKLFEELATDRVMRFNFPVFCADGLYLVRFLARAVCAFAAKLMDFQPTVEEIYSKKLKAVSVCFRIIYLVLSQSIVNLELFAVYNDHSVSNVLEAIAALCLRIRPETELSNYPKVVESYFTLMQELAIVKIDFFVSLSSTVFSYVITTIKIGLDMPDASIITKSSSVLSSILMYIFDCVNKRKRMTDTERLLSLVRENMVLFDQIMETILGIAVYEHNLKLTFISDSFLLLILLNHEGFNRLYEKLIQTMNLEDDAASARQYFAQFSSAAGELVPSKSSTAFLELLLSLRRELSVLMNAPIADSTDMLV